MNEKMFTPGPWKVEVNGVRVYSATRTEWAVADCAPSGARLDRAEANALLIAAAPELLEALELAMPVLEAIADELNTDLGATYQEGGRATEPAWTEARAAADRFNKAHTAIAKARGES